MPLARSRFGVRLRLRRKASAQRQRSWAVFEASPVGQVQLDREQRIVHVNPAFTAIVGVTAEQLQGRSAVTLFHPDSAPPDLDAAADLLAGRRERHRAERLLQAPDGSAVPVLLELSPLVADGEVVGLAAAVTDLTEQVALREELRRSQRRLEALFHRSPVALVEGDAEGRVVRVNEALTQMLGYLPEELVGTDGLVLASEPMASRNGLEALKDGRDYAADRVYRHKDGSLVPALLVTAAMRDEAGRPDGYAAFLVDTRPLVAQQEALQQRQQFLDAILQTADVGIGVALLNGEVWRNPAHRALLGLPEEHAASTFAASRPTIEVRDLEGRLVEPADYPLTRALRGEDVGQVPLVIGPAGGTLRTISSRSTTIRDSDGAVLGAVTAMTDVTELTALTQALERERAALAEAQRVGRLGSFSYDLDADVWWLSPQLLGLWGHTEPQPWAELRGQIDPRDRDDANAALRHALGTSGRHQTRFRVHRADDAAVRWLSATLEVQAGPDGRRLVIGTHQDVTDEVQAEDALRAAQVRLEAIFAASPDYTYVRDLRTEELVFQSAQPVAGHAPSELRQSSRAALYELIHPHDLAAVVAADAAVLGLPDGQHVQVRYRLRGADGAWRWIRRHTTPFARDPETGTVMEVLGIARDVSDVVATEELLSHAATHDVLTGLPNRARLTARLQESLGRAQRHGTRLGVLFCDLDGFKAVNDTAGHAAGDALLIEIADRLRSAVRSDTLVARVGGDEFVVVVDDLGSDAEQVLDLLAGRIVHAVRRPVLVDGMAYDVSCSIGLAATSSRSDTAEELLDRADKAMYDAKRAGKDQVAGLPRPRAAEADADARTGHRDD